MKNEMSIASAATAIPAMLLLFWLFSAPYETTALTPHEGAPVYAASGADTRPPVATTEQKPAKKSRKMGWGRDPFENPEQAVSTTKAADGKVRLVAIITGRKGRMAIFGHSIVEKGDFVGRERIVDIAENRVTVAHDGYKRVIALQEAR